MFEWDDILSVGIEVVDDQHQELFRIGRELVYVLENTSAGLDQYDDIIKLLKELHTYANYHFSEEEKLMEAADFIGLPAHRFQHKIFIRKIEEIELGELDEDQKNHALDLLDFLANWITNHIMKVDREYIPDVQKYLASK
ncbi:MAG TPA: bacteriohemerythrin [Halanaerobiales bacterium]|nr:bacteriohemerythrin [Halanaerobiales bacterium]HPZ63717.1 bacteriohemerythrin [Halanaerobiales bacterium]HQD04927.1 bacteriohemerythrin [Halanaerobiales bacterium]